MLTPSLIPNDSIFTAVYHFQSSSSLIMTPFVPTSALNVTLHRIENPLDTYFHCYMRCST